MRLHGNARLSVKGRELLIDRVQDAGWSLSPAAEAAGISDRAARKWLARYRSEGQEGLFDRSSAPSLVANRTDARRVEVIAALRRLRMTGLEIAECLQMAHSTVSGILTRLGLGKLGRLGLEPAPRYERERPGELIHIDVKKLRRIQGGARASHQRTSTALAAGPNRRGGRSPPTVRLSVCARRDRRRDPPGLRRSACRPEGVHRDRLPASRGRTLRQRRHPGGAVDHRRMKAKWHDALIGGILLVGCG